MCRNSYTCHSWHLYIFTAVVASIRKGSRLRCSNILFTDARECLFDGTGAQIDVVLSRLVQL